MHACWAKGQGMARTSLGGSVERRRKDQVRCARISKHSHSNSAQLNGGKGRARCVRLEGIQLCFPSQQECLTGFRSLRVSKQSVVSVRQYPSRMLYASSQLHDDDHFCFSRSLVYAQSRRKACTGDSAHASLNGIHKCFQFQACQYVYIDH